jgi:hypothetical protein
MIGSLSCDLPIKFFCVESLKDVPEHLEHPDDLDHPEHPHKPEHPEHPENLENPEDPENPEHVEHPIDPRVKNFNRPQVFLSPSTSFLQIFPLTQFHFHAAQKHLHTQFDLTRFSFLSATFYHSCLLS